MNFRLSLRNSVLFTWLCLNIPKKILSFIIKEQHLAENLKTEKIEIVAGLKGPYLQSSISDGADWGLTSPNCVKNKPHCGENLHSMWSSINQDSKMAGDFENVRGNVHLAIKQLDLMGLSNFSMVMSLRFQKQLERIQCLLLERVDVSLIPKIMMTDLWPKVKLPMSLQELLTFWGEQVVSELSTIFELVGSQSDKVYFDERFHQLRKSAFLITHLLIEYNLVGYTNLQNLFWENRKIELLAYRCRIIEGKLSLHAGGKDPTSFFDEAWREIKQLIKKEDCLEIRKKEIWRAVIRETIKNRQIPRNKRVKTKLNSKNIFKLTSR